MHIKPATSLLVLCLWSTAALANPLQTAPPQSVGLSPERLERITETLRSDVAKGIIPGAVVMISRRDKIAYFEALGNLDPQTKTAMGKDSIFRIYSMSKPVTSACAMMLFEQGRLSLSDPVDKYIPQFKDVKVGEEKRDADGKVTLDLVAPKRPMTVQDLMRHTSGLTYGFFGEGAVKKAYLDSKLNSGDFSNAEFAERLAKLPLVYQPGTTWEYSQATDVLGRVIEVVTGKPLSRAFKEMLFDPLGMVDTSFYVTDPAKHGRLAEPFANDRTIGIDATFFDPRAAGKYESGGGGLMSTATDYARFLQMLLNGGLLGDWRYLGPRTIAYMTTDHMSDLKRSPYDLVGLGHTFGHGFSVRTTAGAAPAAGSVGDYAWGGAGGTYFWVDPKERMFVVLMMQAPSKRAQYRPLLRNMVYAAIID